MKWGRAFGVSLLSTVIVVLFQFAIWFAASASFPLSSRLGNEHTIQNASYYLWILSLPIIAGLWFFYDKTVQRSALNGLYFGVVLLVLTIAMAAAVLAALVSFSIFGGSFALNWGLTLRAFVSDYHVWTWAVWMLTMATLIGFTLRKPKGTSANQ